jgi:hypothetical protein
MGRRSEFSDKTIAALKPRPKRYSVPDPELAGLMIRVTPSGARSFAVVTIDPTKKQVWTTLGACHLLTLEEARKQAREAIRSVRAGLGKPAPVAAPASFNDIASQWYQQRVVERGLRSAREIERVLNKYLRPEWGNRPFAGIRRGDVTALLDKLFNAGKKAQADHVLAVVRSIMGSHHLR